MREYLKKTGLFLAFFACCTSAMQAQSAINIPDPHFLSKLIALGVDIDNNGQITDYEANVYQGVAFFTPGEPDAAPRYDYTLDIHGTTGAADNISDLTGIEYFTSILVINCSHNNLTTLNLLAIGTGHPLKGIDCSFNQITSLDLRNLLNLSVLDCSNNNLNQLNIIGADMLFNLNATSNPNLTCIPVGDQVAADYYNMVGMSDWFLDSTTYFAVNCGNTAGTPPQAPVALSQSFCQGKTVADLVATGSNLQWYAASTGGLALANSTVLTSGTYYVSQTINSVESTRTMVSVTITTTPALAYNTNVKKSQIEKRIDEEYSIKLLDEMWILSGFSPIFEEFQNKVATFSELRRKLEKEDERQKGKQEIVKELAEGIIPLSPNVPDKISMKEMIKDEFCKVCGREAKVGTDAYNFMVNKLNELLESQLPKDKQITKKLFANNYFKELEQKSNNLEYNQSDNNDLLNTIEEDLRFNKKRKEEAKDVQESIDLEEDNKKKLLAQNDGLTEDQLQNAYQNIRNWYESKNHADREIVLLEKDELELEKQISTLQESYNNLAKNSVASIYSKINTAFDKIKIAFKNAKERNTQDFLITLEQKANDYLEKLNFDGFFGIIRIIKNTDGSARVVLQDKNNTFIENPNQALKTTMYMSLLFAVSDLTGLKRENDYPLIFDAPTSSFSPQKESDFFSIISNINKQ
ncbi:MAG: hypothetical protein CFE24_08590 [Flavobacterium sp. BFFFF2]|nr:MAG: hypothetical protein CFE24_08590 [Flavobacterium sp. BFFFF2]